MSNNTNTGGPAFPVLIVDRPKRLEHFNGMTLRDYFAAKAMQGYAYYSATHSKFIFPNSELAKEAYSLADAMMEARNAAQ